jgi:hypothetical protein
VSGLALGEHRFQDHTWSIWNRVTGGPSSIWDRFHDGSYRYTKYTLLQRRRALDGLRGPVYVHINLDV